MVRINQGQTQSGQVEHDETVGGTTGNPHQDSASFAALESINGVATSTSTISVDAPASVKIDGTVKMFLADKNPRGEALFEYMMDNRVVAEAIAADPEMMYVIHNESNWDDRNADPVPDDFTEVYTALPEDVSVFLAYVEEYLSDYTGGQDSLDGVLGDKLSAEDLVSSDVAMHVIQTGDEQTDLQNYRTGGTSIGLLSLTSTDTSFDLNQSSYNAIPWDTVRTNDGPYTQVDNKQVEITGSGTYRISFTVAHTTTSSRTAPKIRLRKNGSNIMDGAAKSGYIRGADGHEESSNTLVVTADLSSGDKLEVVSKREANSGTVTMLSRESVWSIEKIN